MGWPRVWNLDSGSNAALHPHTVPQIGFQPGAGGPTWEEQLSDGDLQRCRRYLLCGMQGQDPAMQRHVFTANTEKDLYKNKFYSLPSIARLAEK